MKRESVDLANLRLPPPGTTLAVSSIVVGSTWLVLDFVLRDPWTVLFIVIALGSSFLVRNVTSGVFSDQYWPVVSAVQVFFCVAFFAVPGLALLWIGNRWLSPPAASLMIIGWMLFYIAALAFLFSPPLP